MDRRVGPDGSGDLLQTGHHNFGLGLATGHNGKGASTLTVNTKVLGEGLTQEDAIVALGEEVNGICVLLEVT